MKKYLKVDDIRPKKIMINQKIKMQKDIDKLGSGLYEHEYVNCPACYNDNYNKLYSKYNTIHVICNDCETQYVNPRLTEQSLKLFYEESDNYEFWADEVYKASYKVREKNIFKPRLKLLSELIKGKNLHNSFVEVGAGYGIFSKMVQESGIFRNVIGIEPTPGLANILRGHDIDTLEKTYEEVILKEKVSVIASFEVIEHLHSPYKFLKWIFDNLECGGCVYLSCPNIKGFETTVLGKLSGTVDHQHINLFHPKSIKQLLKKVGFSGINIETPGELDCDLIQEKIKNNEININDIPDDYKNFFQAEGSKKNLDLQGLLIKNKMSSHMIMTAFKPF